MVYLSSVSKHGPKTIFYFIYRTFFVFHYILYFINKLKVNMKP